MTEGKRETIRQLLNEYDNETAEHTQDALGDILGGTIKEIMEDEMDSLLCDGLQSKICLYCLGNFC